MRSITQSSSHLLAVRVTESPSDSLVLHPVPSKPFVFGTCPRNLWGFWGSHPVRPRRDTPCDARGSNAPRLCRALRKALFWEVLRHCLDVFSASGAVRSGACCPVSVVISISSSDLPDIICSIPNQTNSITGILNFNANSLPKECLGRSGQISDWARFHPVEVAPSASASCTTVRGGIYGRLVENTTP